jgi:hypothetical protein
MKHFPKLSQYISHLVASSQLVKEVEYKVILVALLNLKLSKPYDFHQYIWRNL